MIMDGLPERERKHACTMCHKRFDRPSTLKKHLLVHTGEKAYQCDCCGRRFGVASNLNRHVKRCILRTSPTISNSTPTASSGSAQTTPSPPPSSPAKRRRRAPAQPFWVPMSLRGFCLLAAAQCGTVISTPSPLNDWDERDSYAPASLNPYHPAEWTRLPGPDFPTNNVEWQETDVYGARGSHSWGMSGVLGVRVF